MTDQHDLLTDDYVAGLLAKEAASCALKYSTMGLEAFKPRQAPNIPKPNTRFLQNVLRGTKYHNEVLLAKESTEAQARLHELSHSDREREASKSRRQRPVNAREVRGRQLADIAAITSGGVKRKRKRAGDDDGDDGKKTEAMRLRSPADKAQRVPDVDTLPNKHTDKDEKRESRTRRRRPSLERFTVHKSREDGEDERRARKHRRRRQSSSEEDEREEESRKRRRRRRREHGDDNSLRSRSRSRSRSRERHRRGNRDELCIEPRDIRRLGDNPARALQETLPREAGHGKGQAIASRSGEIALRGVDSNNPDTDEDDTGPALPPIDRTANADEQEDEWAAALKAVRERNRFREQGAARLRQSGHTEEQIKQWERGPETSIDNVQWSKRGEMREWDRGKEDAV